MDFERKVTRSKHLPNGEYWTSRSPLASHHLAFDPSLLLSFMEDYHMDIPLLATAIQLGL